MKNFVFKYQKSSLLFIALLCGVIWRAELDYHGWAGLNWIGYFHYAIPVGFILILVWCNCFIQEELPKRALLNFTAIIFGIVIYCFLRLSLTNIFIGGPSAMFLHLTTPKWLLTLIFCSVFIIVPLIPLGVYLILRLFGYHVKPLYVFISILAMFLSVPLAIVFLELFNHRGSSDVIHTIKSGFLIPLWIISVGIIFFKIKNKNITE